MLSYCLKYIKKKNTVNTNLNVLMTGNGKTIILSKCAICGAKKSKFIKYLKNLQEAKGLLSNLGIITPFSFIEYEMNDIINKILLPEYHFIPEMRLRQAQFISSACGPFTKYKERIQKFKETEDSR